MKNLIMADLKVLGNRLWAIPLMAISLVVLVSMIPSMIMPETVRHFMIALLAPCLLIFELLREEKKRNSDSMIMTMPVSKEDYVYAKYITIIILCMTSFPAAWITNILVSSIEGKNFSDTLDLSLINDVIKIMVPIIFVIFFFMPIYHFTKKMKTSAITGLFIVWVIIYGFLESVYSYFYTVFLNENIDQFGLRILAVVSSAALVHIFLKIKIKKVRTDWFITGWYAIFLFLAILFYDMLMQNLRFTYVYIHIVQNLDNVTGDQKEKFIHTAGNFRIYVSAMFLSMTASISVLMYIRKKATSIFPLNSVSYFFSPLIIFILIHQLIYLIYYLSEKALFLSPDRLDLVDSISKIVLLYVALFIGMIISARASIYLLKNNRTLK